MGVSRVLHLRATGRGAHYTLKRALYEMVVRLVSPGGWPGRVWGRLPGRAAVDLIRHQLPLLPPRPGRDRPLRVAFASDLHIGPLTSPALLDNAFALLAEARPDVLVLGGDYVYLDATEAMVRELEARVAAVPAATKLAVLGNHDLWTHHDQIEAALARAGATVLINHAVRLPAPFDDVAFFGLDDPWAGQPDVPRAFAAAAGAALTLGAVHSPEVLPRLAGRGVGLTLCGHTHGGQIALPSGPVVVHGKLGRQFHAGLFATEAGHLFVSRGLGSVELPFRAYARPDVSLFTLGPR